MHKATGLTEYEIDWSLPLAKGWAYFHAQRLLDGEAMTWPAAESTPDGQWWLRTQERLTNMTL